ncbi:unnamed protein product [Lactuca saligna]|uniref:Uncharacterized protein n=1 Tax=Lactuca saligna TaxID=75948 RepID=A0AA35YFI3_LACSI|nr:unnamed protein product [Lactuca saligna]
MDPELIDFVDWQKVAEKMAFLRPVEVKLVPMSLEGVAFRTKVLDIDELMNYTSLIAEHRKETMEALDASGYLKSVIYALVDIIKQSSGCYPLEVDVRTPRGLANRSGIHDGGEGNRRIVVEAGVLEVLSDKLEKYTLNSQAEFEDTEGIWISALLMSILFQDENVVSSSLTIHIIQFLANLLKSDEILDKFFSAQAMASLV